MSSRVARSLGSNVFEKAYKRAVHFARVISSRVNHHVCVSRNAAAMKSAKIVIRLLDRVSWRARVKTNECIFCPVRGTCCAIRARARLAAYTPKYDDAAK